MTSALEPARPVPSALAFDAHWDALSNRFGRLITLRDLGLATELDLAELDGIRLELDRLIESLR